MKAAALISLNVIKRNGLNTPLRFHIKVIFICFGCPTQPTLSLKGRLYISVSFAMLLSIHKSSLFRLHDVHIIVGVFVILSLWRF